MSREPRPTEAASERADLAERLRALQRENERLFRRLLDDERRFRSLARSVWEVQEEERRRLARELHDGLGQILTALKIQLARTADREGVPPDLAAELASGVDLAAHALDETRRLAHVLRPQVLDDLGLFPALRWLARSLDEWTGFGVDLDVDGHLDRGGDPASDSDERLDPGLETLAFRVVQEGLTNAVKHSGARRATVRVERSAGGLRITISDRGEGFDAREAFEGAGTAAGFGLRGMRERVELAGGRFALRSGVAEGTRLTVELPVRTAGPGEADGGGGR